MPLRRTIPIYSQKYDTDGRIDDFGSGAKLVFERFGRMYSTGIRSVPYEELEVTGLKVMETVIADVIHPAECVSLHYWYIDKNGGRLTAHGRVCGHPMVNDSERIDTHEVTKLTVDEQAGEAVLITDDAVYHCPLSHCLFRYQDEHPDILPGYDRLKYRYKDKMGYPEIESGKVLLVLSDYDKYYFHSLCVKDDSGNCAEFDAIAHTGMTQDSLAIGTFDLGGIEIRYFPHFRNLELYSLETGDRPAFVQNIGRDTLYISDSDLVYRIDPGERIELKEENAVSVEGMLPNGDLYPAE